MLMKRRQTKLSADLSPPRFKTRKLFMEKEIYSKSFFSQSGKVRKFFSLLSLFFALLASPPLLLLLLRQLLPSFDKVFVALFPSQKAFSSFFQK